MKRSAILLCLALVSCGPPKQEVVKNVCDPANEENAPSIETLAHKHGYDLKRTETICRDHIQAFYKQFSEDVKVFNEKTPYDN